MKFRTVLGEPEYKVGLQRHLHCSFDLKSFLLDTRLPTKNCYIFWSFKDLWINFFLRIFFLVFQFIQGVCLIVSKALLELNIQRCFIINFSYIFEALLVWIWLLKYFYVSQVEGLARKHQIFVEEQANASIWLILFVCEWFYQSQGINFYITFIFFFFFKKKNASYVVIKDHIFMVYLFYPILSSTTM